MQYRRKSKKKSGFNRACGSHRKGLSYRGMAVGILHLDSGEFGQSVSEVGYVPQDSPPFSSEGWQ